MTHTYTYDLKLVTTITVPAQSEAEARQILEDRLGCAEANFGCFPNGDPILAEVHVDDEEKPLIEIDGEAV